MAELGRINPQKRPTPEAMAQLPGHIQARFDDPNYDVRKDPEAMGHLVTNAMGGGVGKLVQGVAAAKAQPGGTTRAPGAPQAQQTPGEQQARARQGRLSLPNRMSSAPGQRPVWGKVGATPPGPTGTPLQTAGQIAMSGAPQAKKRMAAAQAQQPIGGPQQPLAGQPATGPSFAMRGLGRYYNPSNVQGQQFNKPAVKSTVEKGLNAFATAGFYRRAGLTEGVRGFLGLPPTPSHMNDWIRTQHNQNVQGVNPQAMHF